MKIVFIHQYPFDEAPSQRFRFEQYFTTLKSRNIEHDVQPFWDSATWNILYQKGHWFAKIWGIIKGFWKRVLLLFSIGKYDFVFIHRASAPLGPAFYEWLLAKIFRKKIIYDFDDAIWIPNFSEHNEFLNFLKFYSKVGKICSYSYKIACGNNYIAEFAKKNNSNSPVIINPTTIDTENYHNKIKNQDTKRFVIGWTGTHTTLWHLFLIAPVIKELEERNDFDFIVIAEEKPKVELKSLKFIPWNKNTEIDDLLQFNIGVMPMFDNAFTRGKCGFKALQYMALGMPALVSPVGVNTEIVDNGVNGFICKSNEDWKKNILLLMNDVELRKKMGVAAREKIIKKYSVLSNTENFLNLFT